jgi:hypothetical protein
MSVNYIIYMQVISANLKMKDILRDRIIYYIFFVLCVIFSGSNHTHEKFIYIFVNFLIHPNELITEEDLRLATERRASNYLSYLLSDVLRRKLKQKNLGLPAAALYEKEIRFWKKKEYEFRKVKSVVNYQ